MKDVDKVDCFHAVSQSVGELQEVDKDNLLALFNFLDEGSELQNSMSKAFQILGVEHVLLNSN